jgi:hypothetical protein
MQDLEILSIASGKFTDNGNFSGYTLTGKRVHIFARQMSSANMPDDTSVKYPFPVLAQSKAYEWADEINSDGTVVRKAGAIKDRLTATAVFADEDKLAEALAADKGLAARVEAKVAKRVKSLMADISPEQLA